MFEFFSVPRILFGRGQIARLGEVCRTMGRRALVLFNGRARPAIAEILTQSGIGVVSSHQTREPVVEDIEKSLNLGRTEGCDFVVGLGGGSAIDAAKAVAGLMTNPGRPTDYMEVVGEGKKIAHPAAPWVAIPTTAGTGAEVTRNAVIGFPERKFKASIRSELLLPRVAIVDPQLGVEVTPDVTAASGMDALCQCIESYTSRNANPLTDGLATKGIELAAGSLRQAYQAGHDLDARESMAMAALISGITLTNAGLGAVHGFAAPLGANFPIPHGVVCAALLPGVLEANIAEARKAARQDLLDRYARIGRILSADRQLPAESALAACVEQTRSLCRDLSIPRLSRFGLSEAEIPAMVALAMQSSSMKYNPVALDAATLSNILRNSL